MSPSRRFFLSTLDYNMGKSPAAQKAGEHCNIEQNQGLGVLFLALLTSFSTICVKSGRTYPRTGRCGGENCTKRALGEQKTVEKLAVRKN
jgi:hypothetical protein